MAKIKYINLINDFWAADAVRHFDPVATRIYFEVLARLNANRWEPVAIPMRYWQRTLYDKPKRIYDALAELKAASLLRVVTQRAKATWYSVPEMERETAEGVQEIILHSVGNNPTAETPPGDNILHSVGNNPTVTPYILNKDIDISHDDARTREDALMQEFRAPAYDNARMAIAQAVGVGLQELPRYLDDFAQHCRALGREHTNINDLRSHFYSWLKLHYKNGQNQRPAAGGNATSQPAGAKQPARTIEGVIAALAAKSDSGGFGTY